MGDEEGESKPHIIIDNGTGYCKAGLSGEEGPRAVFVITLITFSMYLMNSGMDEVFNPKIRS